MSRHLSNNERVNNVVVVGGTHGNERNGVYLARWLRETESERSFNFNISVVEGNTPACEKNVRYVEEDLNRQFLLSRLKDPSLKSGEAIRAKEINNLLGPKESDHPNADLVIDLHGTTAPCGVALMMHPRDEFSREIGGYLSGVSKEVSVVNWRDTEVPMLPSVGRSGFTFEVGPVSWGVVCPRLYQLTKDLLLETLQYVNKHNEWVDSQQKSEKPTSELTVFQNANKNVSYPLTAFGTLNGFVHKSISDFGVRLTKGTPILETFKGEIITWEEEDEQDVELYPLFVNEAAFYESNIAFYVVKKLLVETKFLKA